MPELLRDGLPEHRTRGPQRDFSQWADGQAWKFVKGEDYQSTTETFRAAVRRWAKERKLSVELRPYPALDRDGTPVPLAKADGIALGIRFKPVDEASPSGAPRTRG